MATTNLGGRRFNQINLQQGVGEFFTNLFALRVYGDKNLTSRTRKDQAVMGIALFLIFFVDTIVWTTAVHYALSSMFPTWSFVLALPFGFALALALVLFDRSVVVADTTVGKAVLWSIGGRAVFLLVISLLTAVPAEVTLFSSNIEQHIARQEKTSVDKIREKALEVERKRFDARIAEKQVELAAQAKAATVVASGDVDTFRGDRDSERQKLLAAQAVKRQSLVDTLAEKSEQVALEAAGKGPSGKYGDGPAFQAMKDQETQLRKDLENFEAQAEKSIEAFDLATVAKTADLRLKRDQKGVAGQDALTKTLDQLRKEKDRKREEIMLMEPGKLASLYGESWNQAKDFLARYEALEQLREQRPAVNVMVWGCRLVMVILGLCILGLKLMASQEFKLYYSLAAQAKAGDTGAQGAAEIMGYPDFDNYGLSDQARDLLTDLYDARLKVWECAQQLERELQELCQPDPRTGVCKSMMEIEGKAHAAWLANSKEVGEVNKLEQKLRLTGVEVPEWEEDQFGRDPRTEPAIWKVDEHRLATFGWEDPSTVVHDGNQARETVIEKRRELRRLLSLAERELYSAISANFRTPKRQLEAARREFYDVQVLPVIEDLELAEQAMTKAGLPLPPWPADFADPRANLFQKLCVLNDRVLKDSFGWRGADRTGGVPPAPTTPVTPVPGVGVGETLLTDDEQAAAAKSGEPPAVSAFFAAGPAPQA